MGHRFLLTAIPLALLFTSGVLAQYDMAQCKIGWEWNRNSLGQDPCRIGSMMDASCRGLVLYPYPPLNATQYYLPPDKDHSGDLSCDCNTVMYSLYMACSLCQGGQFYSWNSWIAECDGVYVSQYPGDIAEGTAVPYWAYFNVTTLPDELWNDTTARRVGRNPETFPVRENTTVTLAGTVTVTLTPAGGPRPTNGSNDGLGGNPNLGASVGRKSNVVGAIVGGVVGSVVPLLIFAVMVFLYLRYRKQKDAEQQQVEDPNRLDPHKSDPTLVYGPTATPVTYTPYNPSDPLTFPPENPQNWVTHTTPSNNAHGTYSGVPEL